MNRAEKIKSAFSNTYAWAAYHLFVNGSYKPVVTFIPGMTVIGTGVPCQIQLGDTVWDLHDLAGCLDDPDDVNDWMTYFAWKPDIVAIFGEETLRTCGTAYMFSEEFIKGWIKMLEHTILAISQNRNLNADYARDNYWFIQQLAEIKCILEDAFRQED